MTALAWWFLALALVELCLAIVSANRGTRYARRALIAHIVASHWRARLRRIEGVDAGFLAVCRALEGVTDPDELGVTGDDAGAIRRAFRR